MRRGGHRPYADEHEDGGFAVDGQGADVLELLAVVDVFDRPGQLDRMETPQDPLQRRVTEALLELDVDTGGGVGHRTSIPSVAVSSYADLMTSTQDHPKNTRQSARSAWGLIFTFIGLAIVLGSLVSFVLAQVDDDADKLLEAIYLAMIGMGTIAFGESRARSSSNED